MSKFLWFLSGCATGLLAAAAISVLNEGNTASSASWDNDEDSTSETDYFTTSERSDSTSASWGDNEGSTVKTDFSATEEAPIFPMKHCKVASVISEIVHPFGKDPSNGSNADENPPDTFEPSNAPA